MSHTNFPAFPSVHLSHKLMALLALLTLVFPAALYADDTGFIEVHGEAEVWAKPDFAQIDIFIERKGKSSQIAKADSDLVVDKLINALKPWVEQSAIQSTDFYIQPEYRWHDGKREFIAYKAQRKLVVKLTTLESYSQVLEKLSAMDAGRVSFSGAGFDDVDALQHQALVLALKNAKQKAKVMAESLDMKVDGVLQISEKITGSPIMPMHAPQMEMAAASTGQKAESHLVIKKQKVRAKVVVRFALD